MNSRGISLSRNSRPPAMRVPVVGRVRINRRPAHAARHGVFESFSIVDVVKVIVMFGLVAHRFKDPQRPVSKRLAHHQRSLPT